MGESFYDLLKTRRGVRSYTGERVPRETLERIARAARCGPNDVARGTAGHRKRGLSRSNPLNGSRRKVGPD